MTLAEEVAAVDAARADANQKTIAAYEAIKDEADNALNGGTQGARSDAAAKIIGHAASLWVQSIRMAAITADAQGKIIASIVSDASRPE